MTDPTTPASTSTDLAVSKDASKDAPTTKKPQQATKKENPDAVALVRQIVGEIGTARDAVQYTCMQFAQDLRKERGDAPDLTPAEEVVLLFAKTYASERDAAIEKACEVLAAIDAPARAAKKAADEASAKKTPSK